MDAVVRGAGPAAACVACFHCGDPVDADAAVREAFDGETRAFCCGGCAAAARWIRDAKLGDYYRLRDAAGSRVEAAGSRLRRPGTARTCWPAMRVAVRGRARDRAAHRRHALRRLRVADRPRAAAGTGRARRRRERHDRARIALDPAKTALRAARAHGRRSATAPTSPPATRANVGASANATAGCCASASPGSARCRR
ncbi:MAG: heavy metal translocating P-type ATPase metal-binding domain-containing protein [Lysobacterales bacterium]